MQQETNIPSTQPMSTDPPPRRLPATACSACTSRIRGTGYQCNSCDAYHLCSSCYGIPNRSMVHNHHNFHETREPRRIGPERLSSMLPRGLLRFLSALIHGRTRTPQSTTPQQEMSEQMEMEPLTAQTNAEEELREEAQEETQSQEASQDSQASARPVLLQLIVQMREPVIVTGEDGVERTQLRVRTFLFSIDSEGRLVDSHIFPDFDSDQAFQELLNRLFNEHQPQGTPPASKSVVESLQVVDVLEVKEDRCTICLENFGDQDDIKQKEEEDEPVTPPIIVRLPCSHTFHKECLMTWLSKHNSCVLCRYELPNPEDQEYEEERKKRMASRGIDESSLASISSVDVREEQPNDPMEADA